MKNILLLTNIYPTGDKDYGGTSVCHFFTKEWQKDGYNVVVVHFESRFPAPYYWIANLFRKQIQAKTGAVANLKVPSKPITHSYEGVKVIRVPLFKLIPHRPFSNHEIDSALQYVIDYLNDNSFTPDIITAHFILPQLQMLHHLKLHFPKAKTCMVLHTDGSTIPDIYKHYKAYMNSVDIWGFRSVAFKEKFESIYGANKKSFLCYSGIPDGYVCNDERQFEDGVNKFLFVGSLFKLKRVEDTIKALRIVNDNNIHFDIVGDGAEMNNLLQLVKNAGLQNQVSFHGRKSRDDAQKFMAASDCYVMTSSREAFGLVYVEAMAKGCITIATKGQGMDGIIVDGENGFLCESENPDALARVISHIRSLSKDRLGTISQNARKTASMLTDKNVAKSYINSIIEL